MAYFQIVFPSSRWVYSVFVTGYNNDSNFGASNGWFITASSGYEGSYAACSFYDM
jgi:hypothetical protein